MVKKIMTDTDVELEIERLKESEAVKLAQKEERCKHRRRKYLYQLRWYEKRGKELMDNGITPEDFNIFALEQGDVVD